MSWFVCAFSKKSYSHSIYAPMNQLFMMLISYVVKSPHMTQALHICRIFNATKLNTTMLHVTLLTRGMLTYMMQPS